MAILQECPVCRRKQKVPNKLCVKCGINLEQKKKQKKVRYWVNFCMPDKTQKRELVGFSIQEAKDLDGKRKGQKRENRLWDIKKDNKITFQQLTKWYLNLDTIKNLKSFKRLQIATSNFNNILGAMTINKLLPTDIQSYQSRRQSEGRSYSTIDTELSIVKTMLNRAIDNDILDSSALKPFRKIKKLLKFGSNARQRILNIDEYAKLVSVAPKHLQDILIVGFNTGMRLGEIRALQWSYIDKDRQFIRLPADITKEGRSKTIPINHYVKQVLDNLPRHIQHNFVFTYRNRPIYYRNGLRQSFLNSCEKIGIPYGRNNEQGTTFHDLRRTCKTHMLQAGIPKEYRDILLGHALTGMDSHYIKPTDDMLTEIMQKYTNYLDQQFQFLDQNIDQTEKRNNKQ